MLIVCLFFVLLRYDLAKLLNFDLNDEEQKEAFKQVLACYDCDDDWDEEKPSEKAYKNIGLKRYKLEKKQLDFEGQVDGMMESFESQSSKEHKGNLLSIVSGKEMDPVNIKIECPEWVDMEEALRLVRSGELKLVTTINGLKKLKAQASAVNTGEGQGLAEFCILLAFDCIFVFRTIEGARHRESVDQWCCFGGFRCNSPCCG